MSDQSRLKTVSMAVSAAMATSLFTISTAHAEGNPFQLTELNSSYLVADSHKEGSCGEGKCGSKMEGKCGMKMMMKKMDADEDGAISREEFMDHHQKKFTKMDKNEDGKVTEDEMKMMMEKMHEGKCGGMKSNS